MMELVEYDLHPRGARVDDALAQLERVISAERARAPSLFAVVTGYGSSGGTAKIKASVLSACRRYLQLRHIRGYLDGEFAGDMFSPQGMAFPDMARLPVSARRAPNPGVVYICV